MLRFAFVPMVFRERFRRLLLLLLLLCLNNTIIIHKISFHFMFLI